MEEVTCEFLPYTKGLQLPNENNSDTEFAVFAVWQLSVTGISVTTSCPLVWLL